MHRHLLALLFFAMPVVSRAESPIIRRDSTAETVVLLHGLGLGSWAMARLGHAFTRDGYHVVNLTYPSRSVRLEILARDWLPAQLEAHRVESASRLHFVTHSMGGILLRAWLSEQLRAGRVLPANLGRTVMLAPPNQGSEVVARLRNFPPFRWFTGINGRRLGPGADELPRTLGPWPSAAFTHTSASRPNVDAGSDSGSGSNSGAGELGVIAGDRSLNLLFSSWLAGPDDGKVAVASTHLAGESAHCVLHHSHTWLQWRADTARAVIVFLRTGRFA